MAKCLRKVLVEPETNFVMAKNDLAVARANMVMATADLALEKQKREAEVVMVREKLVEMKREVEAAVERYKPL